MGSSFNLVKKPNKEEEFEEEEENVVLDEDKPSKKSGDDDMKKRLFLLMGIIVGGVIILLFILWIVSLLSPKNYSYDDIEAIMTDAAKSYFADYPNYLPANDGDIVEINAVNLVAAEKMKDLSEYRSDVACAGTVQVQKAGNDYLYVPYLNCGDSYYSIELYNKVLTDNPATTSGEGLYDYNNSHVFRGENVNNYVQLEKSLWRIVKITAEGEVVLIHDKGLDYYQPWDDRYNEERLYESGINTYNVSRMKEYLEKVFSNPNADNGEDILSDKDKARMVTYTLCVGNRAVTSESKNNSEECRQKLQTQKMGLLTLSDYLYASLDTTCKSASTKSCMNYNYLSMDDEWWLVTPNAENTSTVYKVDKTGVVKADIASTYSKVRPVIHLNTRAMYLEGKGTLEEPYKIK